MKVKHCPSCGSGAVDKSVDSLEYETRVTWSCEECDWHYKKKNGMGVNGTTGTHPEDVTQENQSTLSQVGEYCPNCEYVVKPAGHLCDPKEIVKQADEPIPIDEIKEHLDEWHYNPESEIKESIRNEEIALEPTFFRAELWPNKESDGKYRRATKKNTAMHDAVLTELKNADDPLRFSEIFKRMATDSSIETAFVDVVCRDLMSKGKVKRTGHATLYPVEEE